MFEPLHTITADGLKAVSEIYKKDIYIIINGEYYLYKSEENHNSEEGSEST